MTGLPRNSLRLTFVPSIVCRVKLGASFLGIQDIARLLNNRIAPMVRIKYHLHLLMSLLVYLPLKMMTGADYMGPSMASISAVECMLRGIISSIMPWVSRKKVVGILVTWYSLVTFPVWSSTML